jgi:murein DD-endopeptidase MepM/ murein hydrolase activator NlpD
LEILSGSDYEIVINTTVLPAEGTGVKVNVPYSLVSSLMAGQAMAVYYEVPEDEDQPAAYRPLASNYDSATRVISISVPSVAYQLEGNGTYSVKLKIGVASGYEASADPRPVQLGLLVDTPQSAVVINNPNPLAIAMWCPLDAGCLETSRYQPKRWGVDHRGIDLRAVDAKVSGALDGTVLRFDSDWGMMVVRSEHNVILRYLHLSSNQVGPPYKGATIAKGVAFATSGNKSPPQYRLGPHLHLDYIVPTTVACSKEGDISNCLFLQDFLDPFERLVKKYQIVEISNSPKISFSTNVPIVLALKQVDATEGEKPITSDISPETRYPTEEQPATTNPDKPATKATPGGTSLARGVVWTVTSPRLGGPSVFLGEPVDGGSIDEYKFVPHTTAGLGKLNEATFTPQVSGQYTITAKWQDTRLTSTYTVNVVGPIVSSVTPLSATVNQPATFTVVGEQLVDGMVFSLAGCANPVETGIGTTTMRQFSCTPTVAGNESGTITAPGLDAPLRIFTVQVSADGVVDIQFCNGGNHTSTMNFTVDGVASFGVSHVAYASATDVGISYCHTIQLPVNKAVNVQVSDSALLGDLPIDSYNQTLSFSSPQRATFSVDFAYSTERPLFYYIFAGDYTPIEPFVEN